MKLREELRVVSEYLEWVRRKVFKVQEKGSLLVRCMDTIHRHRKERRLINVRVGNYESFLLTDSIFYQLNRKKVIN